MRSSLEPIPDFARPQHGSTGRGRTQSDDGAGLGLALARWIAVVHGGDVTLSQAPESGTTFTVVLPHTQSG